jgi:hypothetical protein
MPVSYPQFLAGETPALPGALVFDFLAAFLTRTSVRTRIREGRYYSKAFLLNWFPATLSLYCSIDTVVDVL